MFKLLNLKKVAQEYFGATHAWLLSRSKECKTEIDAKRMQKGLQRLANLIQQQSNEYGRLAEQIRQKLLQALNSDFAAPKSVAIDDDDDNFGI